MLKEQLEHEGAPIHLEPKLDYLARKKAERKSKEEVMALSLIAASNYLCLTRSKHMLRVPQCGPAVLEPAVMRPICNAVDSAVVRSCLVPAASVGSAAWSQHFQQDDTCVLTRANALLRASCI